MKPARLSRAVFSTIESLETRCLFSALTPSATVLVFNASTSGGQPSHTDTLKLTNSGSTSLSLSGLSVVADPSVGTDQSADFHVTSGSLPASLAAAARPWRASSFMAWGPTGSSATTSRHWPTFSHHLTSRRTSE
jgi:hypothetical protein